MTIVRVEAVLREGGHRNCIVPTLQRGNSSSNAPALRDAGASLAAFLRRSAHRYTQCANVVIPAGKRVSSAMDGEPEYIHVAWIPANPRYALPAGMTGFDTIVYNDERRSVGTM